MSQFAALLGEKLLGKQGQVLTEQALSGKKVVALYCSAHWCPPCKALTQKLSEWYRKDLQGQGLEVVFISWDTSSDDFDEYYSEMPWLALPYTSKAARDWLSNKYKVKSFPKLILLGPDAELITADGCSAISNDPTGRLMPWRPPSVEEVLREAKLVTPEGGCRAASDVLLQRRRPYGLLFGALWHSECRDFVRQLAEWYERDLKHKDFEIVLVSSDRSEAGFRKFHRDQPWLALDFQDRPRKEQLCGLFGSPRLPTLVIIGSDGSVVNRFGHSAVAADPTGELLPWPPRAVADLGSSPERLREAPTLVALCVGTRMQQEVEELLRPLGERCLQQAKADGSGIPKVAFAVAAEETEVAQEIRAAVGLPLAPSPAVRLVLVDLADCNSWYLGPEGELTTSSVENFLAAYFSGSLARHENSSCLPTGADGDDASTRLPDDSTLGSIRAFASSDTWGQVDSDMLTRHVRVPARPRPGTSSLAIAAGTLLIASFASVWYIRQRRRDL